jgi:biopolymer transport protein TolQ
MYFLLEGNAFVAAYYDADLIGKLLFIALIALSIISWSVLIHKLWITRKVKKESFAFRRSFSDQKHTPLDVRYPTKSHPECPNAFFIIYEMLKNKTFEIFEKNNKEQKEKKIPYLCAQDISMLDSCAGATISTLTKYLEKNLYILSTIVTLAPFLGLLGTVYGILTSFSGMKQEAQAASNQMVLGGLSLALCSTVLGLIDAIPALIGYNYLKNVIHDFDAEMGRFATDVMCSFELNYRKVD